MKAIHEIEYQSQYDQKGQDIKAHVESLHGYLFFVQSAYVTDNYISNRETYKTALHVIKK
ncbi:hypothetical protein [Herminiimonas arsenitoxidans]|uniref:hypothetical protein n=1 Tax=Herminiimonas arsenitoxidans TaxID=1809410 RepID=UPI001E50C97C|nr:hypothetical protein [Herminiimonas arsenitoxidans]